MKELTINLENCYGINKLDKTFNFDTSHIFIIYAPNGSMKTSLAKTFKDFSENKIPKSFKQESASIKCSITGISNDNVFVIESLNDKKYEPSQDLISKLLINKTIKNEYDNIFNEIKAHENILIKELKNKSKLGIDKIEEVFLKDNLEKREFLDYLFYLKSTIEEQENHPFSKMNYSIIFNEDVEKIFKEEGFIEDLNLYIKKYNELISSSPFFQLGVFDHNNADNVIKSLKDNGFLRADHKVFLKGQLKKIDNDEELYKEIKAEKDRILGDTDLVESFNKINKRLQKNKYTIAFANYLKTHPEILAQLEDIPIFKKQIWLDYLCELKLLYSNLIVSYQDNKQKLKDIETQALKENTTWQDVIDIFNKRFINLPFKLDIDNKGKAILGVNVPKIYFNFKGSRVEKDELTNDILSQGEKRALYLLNIIFEIENKKKDKLKTLFIIDDIADSFDYKNKYAIIEYLRDISLEDYFYQIILTHNYDFYRTISHRIIGKNHARNNKLHAIKRINDIELKSEKYQNNPFDHWKDNIHEDSKLIALIPFVRNLLEYTKGEDNGEYLRLTSLLHKKTDTDTITVYDLLIIFTPIINLLPAQITKVTNTSETVIKIIENEANRILVENEDKLELENKIVLSIACKLQMEEYLIKKINDSTFINGITSNQTYTLISKYKSLFNQEISNIAVLDRVNLITPENIHLNSFMYEPILDMSIYELKDLYNDVKDLNNP